MRTKVKRLVAVLCGVVMLCNSGMGLVAHAEEIVNANPADEYHEPEGENVGYGLYDIPDITGARAATLANCSVGISVSANGVRGSIKTGSTVLASEIGIKDIKVDKYVGGKWELVGYAPSQYNINNDAIVMDVWTNSAQKGVLYRITCTHYAILNGVRHELYNETGGVSY